MVREANGGRKQPRPARSTNPHSPTLTPTDPKRSAQVQGKGSTRVSSTGRCSAVHIARPSMAQTFSPVRAMAREWSNRDTAGAERRPAWPARAPRRRAWEEGGAHLGGSVTSKTRAEREGDKYGAALFGLRAARDR